MPIFQYIAGINSRLLILGLVMPLIINCIASCDNRQDPKSGIIRSGSSDSQEISTAPEGYKPVHAILILPKNPAPGEEFRILAIGDEKLRKAQLIVNGPG